MTQVAENVWEIEFENVPDGFERQIKFAIDGAWTHNFGGVFVESGEVTDAVYNGDNITFDTDTTCTVKAQLDLSNFDFSTKEGAKFTITITEEGEVETTAPATEEPATEAPTEEPTGEPATEAPTEEPTGEPATEATTPAEDTYAVEGKPEDIFGGEGADNTMVKGEDGKYTKSYTVDKAYTDASVVAVKNGTEKFGDKDGKEILFDLTGPGTFVVTFDPETKLTTVSGDIVKLKENPSDATSATGTTGKSSGGSSSSGSSSNSGGTNGAVQTGNASMAIIILLVLVSATAGIYFARRKVK